MNNSIPKKFRLNQQIRTPEVLVIDEQGQKLGIMATFEAIFLARQKNLDLVEVSPLATPPVCRIMDYGKYLYRLAKQERQHRAKQKEIQVKELRLRLGTNIHDLEIKAQKANEFLTQGHKVKITVVLRGREKAHFNLAKQKANDFMALIKKLSLNPEKITIEQETKRGPLGLSMIIR